MIDRRYHFGVQLKQMDAEQPRLELLDGGMPDEQKEGPSLESDLKRIAEVASERGMHAESLAAADLYMARRSSMGDDHPWVGALREKAITAYQRVRDTRSVA